MTSRGRWSTGPTTTAGTSNPTASMPWWSARGIIGTMTWGQNVFLTNASVAKPLQPFDDDDRSLIENCCIKERQQQWSLTHPPQKTARAVRVHVLFTLLMCALATAYRLPCEQEESRGESVGWQ